MDLKYIDKRIDRRTERHCTEQRRPRLVCQHKPNDYELPLNLSEVPFSAYFVNKTFEFLAIKSNFTVRHLFCVGRNFRPCFSTLSCVQDIRSTYVCVYRYIYLHPTTPGYKAPPSMQLIIDRVNSNLPTPFFFISPFLKALIYRADAKIIINIERDRQIERWKRTVSSSRSCRRLLSHISAFIKIWMCCGQVSVRVSVWRSLLVVSCGEPEWTSSLLLSSSLQCSSPSYGTQLLPLKGIQKLNSIHCWTVR